MWFTHAAPCTRRYTSQTAAELIAKWDEAQVLAPQREATLATEVRADYGEITSNLHVIK
jgi:hypothetical protein